jgi:hypothetical protein
MLDRRSPHRFFMPKLSILWPLRSKPGGICFEAGVMVGIAFHQVRDCVQNASPRGHPLGSKLRMALGSAAPVVAINLVLIGLVALRFWATFPAVADVTAG